jgi:hypothetical protein
VRRCCTAPLDLQRVHISATSDSLRHLCAAVIRPLQSMVICKITSVGSLTARVCGFRGLVHAGQVGWERVTRARSMFRMSKSRVRNVWYRPIAFPNHLHIVIYIFMLHTCSPFQFHFFSIFELSRPSLVQLLQPPQIHIPLQKRNNIRIKSLPVRVVQVILLALSYLISNNFPFHIPLPFLKRRIGEIIMINIPIPSHTSPQ